MQFFIVEESLSTYWSLEALKVSHALKILGKMGSFATPLVPIVPEPRVIRRDAVLKVKPPPGLGQKVSGA
jgi:hypothetical protein